jgi:hypothetical protein
MTKINVSKIHKDVKLCIKFKNWIVLVFIATFKIYQIDDIIKMKKYSIIEFYKVEWFVMWHSLLSTPIVGMSYNYGCFLLPLSF